MKDLFLHINSWHWLGLGAILFIIEVLTGTGFLLWIGISSVFVGSLLFLFGAMTVGVQFIIFATVAILVALFWRFYLFYHPIKTDKPTLNRRSEQYVGREFTLLSPIVNGMGQIHVDDSIWRVKCDKNLPAGTQVRIIGADGVLLLAEQLSDKIDH